MSEFHTSGVHVFAARQIAEANLLGDEALAEVEAQFGSGFPDYTGGQDGGLAYHNRHHSEAVRSGTEAMGEALGLTSTEMAIGRVAAAAHDIVQLKPRGVMEHESADWLAERLRARGIFPEFAVAIGSLAILGTEPVIENGRIVGQAAATQEYPSKRAELVAHSVACADLGELYSPQGPLLGHDVYKESQGVGQREVPSMDNLLNFQRGQAAFTDGYRYPNAEAERVFGELRGPVAAYSAQMLEQLERGDIESWSQLIEQDKAFMCAHS